MSVGNTAQPRVSTVFVVTLLLVIVVLVLRGYCYNGQRAWPIMRRGMLTSPLAETASASTEKFVTKRHSSAGRTHVGSAMV